jgi:hypothetical protein
MKRAKVAKGTDRFDDYRPREFDQDGFSEKDTAGFGSPPPSGNRKIRLRRVVFVDDSENNIGVKRYHQAPL